LRDPRPALISGGLAALLLLAGWVYRPGPSVPCTSIIVASSNEKYSTLKSLAADFSRQRSGTVGCSAVAVEKVASGDAETRLAAGWTGSDRPDVWAPASTNWVVLLRQQLGTNQVLLPDTYVSIAQSPLVIGMPWPMAQALGWPTTQPKWQDLLLLSQDPRGWGRFGRPEWGQLRLGKTDPRVSTSGLHALIATYYAATGKSGDLVSADVSNPASVAFVGAVEASVAHYSDTAENFLIDLRAADNAGNALSYISAVALEEQELWQYNRGLIGDEKKPSAPPRVTLAAIYPNDGTLIADHPYVVLNGIAAAKGRLANDFQTWLQRPQQQRIFGQAGFRDFQGNQPNSGGGILSSEPNRLLRPPAPAIISAIQQSWQQLRKRARILIVVDATSPATRKRVATAIGKLAADDEVGVWAVGPDEKGQPYQVIRPISAAGPDSSQLAAEVLGIRPETGSPPILAGISAAYAFLSANSDPKRIDAVLVVGGGKNDDSRGPDLLTVLAAVRSQPSGSVTRVFAVSTSNEDDDLMTRIAQASGGVAYTAHDDAAVSSALDRLVAEF
jgi:Ca-activated chloride channel family protein